MMLRAFFFCCIFLVMQQVAYTQDKSVRYNSGKEFMAQGKYAPAMESFLPLLSESKGNDYVKDAHYFYSLCALKAGKTEDGRQIIKQLILKYPSWEKIDDAHYLLSNILFEQGKYKDALDALTPLNSNLQTDVVKLKKFYLVKMDNLDALKWLQQSYPKDKVLAQVLVDKLSGKQLDEKDKMLYNYLVEEFKLEKTKTPTPTKVAQKKSSYNVAVLFPFMVNTLAVENVSRSNQFILDMYQGMKMAVDSLNSAGVSINLFAYDTEKDIEKFKKLLQEPELKQMDLIIGPVYPAHIPLLSEFAEKNNIEIFSPFSLDQKVVDGKSNFFLLQSTHINQGEKLADYVYTTLRPSVKLSEGSLKGRKNEIVVLYGTSEKDSIVANSYKKRLSNYLGSTKSDTTLSLRAFEKIKRDGVGKIKNILGDSSKMSHLNHIIVISSDQVVAANVISATEIMGFDIPVFANSEWLDFNLITIDQLERRKVHFLYPDYLDYSKPAVDVFKEKYISSTHLYPTTFAYQGFDMMLLFGKILSSYGKDFDQELRKTDFIPGAVMPGYIYKDSQSNKFVPITKFVSGKLELVNSPISSGNE